MTDASGSFPRSHRLLRPAEFERVFKGGSCRYSSGVFTILALENGLQYPRLGLAITKRNARLAVNRNRIRRQMRESFRLHQQQLGGFDIIIIGRPGIDAIATEELRAAVDAGWQKLLKRCKKS